jgi:hypothetical protein
MIPPAGEKLGIFIRNLALLGLAFAWERGEMGQKLRPARDAARIREVNSVWIDHAIIEDSDFDWMATIERLTLWNVKVPDGFLRRLQCLWWLDLRGGAAKDLKTISGISRLECLIDNQVRGMADLSQLSSLAALRFLKLYGLAQISDLPSLADLKSLERIELGQMRNLRSIAHALDAPNLRELLLSRRLNVTADDLVRINGHARLEQFDWFAEDVPIKLWASIAEAVKLPKARAMHTADWFQSKGR